MSEDLNKVDTALADGAAEQPVSGDTQTMPRRRADLMKEKERPETAAPAEESKPAENEAEPELPRLQPNRVVRQTPPPAPARREVPTPAALLNATRPGKVTRRPVEEPGYMRRVPLGQTGPEIEAARNSVPTATRRQPAVTTGEDSLVAARPAVQGRQTVARPAAQGRQTADRSQMTQPDNAEDIRPENRAAVRRIAVPPRTAVPEPVTEPYDNDYDDGYDEENHPPRVWLGILCVLFFLSAIVIGLMMIPEDDPGVLGSIRHAVVSRLPGSSGSDAQASMTSTSMSITPTANVVPCDLNVYVTTDKSVTGVRLTDRDGKELDADVLGHNANSTQEVWTLTLSMDTAYEGIICPQVKTGENWLAPDTSAAVEVSVTMPQQAVFAAEPTAEPTGVPPTPAAEEPVSAAQPLLMTTEEPAAVSDLPTATPVAAVVAYTDIQDTPTPEPTAEPTPEPTAVPRLTASSVEASDPSLIGDTVIYSESGKKVSSYDRQTNLIIDMPAGQNYYYNGNDYGVLTFRGNAFRQNAASGTVGDSLTGMKVLWKVPMSAVKGADGKTSYAGVTWTGQPAIIRWSSTVRELSNIVDDKKYTKGLVEVIVAGNDGYIYFIDLADGQETRSAINVGYPMRGTPSIHPTFFPLMTVGQYARKVASGQGKIGLRYYNLLNQKQLTMIDGTDKDLKRSYNSLGSFETSSLYDLVSDSMVTIGTSGILYVAHLGTQFNYNDGTLSISPDYVAMTSRTSSKQKAAYTAVESSFAMYQSYVWYADMEGVLRCVDTTSLTTQWAVKTGDAVEAAIALDLEDSNSLWLYTGNELKNRTKGSIQLRRYNAMNGAENWVLDIPVAINKKKTDWTPGLKASPVIGQNDLSDLVYFTVGCLSADGAKQYGLDTKAVSAATFAVNKETGKVVWAVALPTYTESSPVAVYNEMGRGWIIQCLSDGTILLLDGTTGKTVSTLQVEGTINASPAVFGSTLVIGTTGKKSTSFIYGIDLLDADNGLELEETTVGE